MKLKLLFCLLCFLSTQLTAQNVGVGTTNPLQKLHVNGNVHLDGNLRSMGRYLFFGNRQFLYGDNGSAFYLRSNVTTSTQLILRDSLNVTYGRIAGFNGGDYFGLYDADNQPFLQSYLNNYVRILVDNSEKIRVLNNGNVGIGTSSPGYRLDVYDPAVAIMRLRSASDHTVFQLRTVAGRGNYIRFNRDGAPSYWLYNSINNDLQFRPIAGATTVLFKEDGKVGIGTTNPIEQLHVNGNIRADDRNYYFGAGQHLYGDASSALYWDGEHSTITQMIFRDKEETPYGRIVGTGDGAYFSLYEGNGKAFLQSHVDDYVRILVSNSEKMRVNNNGNVGIGTATPSYRLDVYDPAVAIMRLRSASDHTILQLRTVASKGNYLRFNRDGNPSFWLYNTPTDDLQFRPLAGTSTVVFKQNGNVGIGTTNPGNKLEVNGLIRSKEVLITLSNWPDYVFDDGYKLPTLQQEAAFIEENGHLSGFKSEAAMEEKLTVGDVTKRQQEKIEQMMLHLIEMNEKMERRDTEMKEKVEEMESKVKQLTKQIESLKIENQRLSKQN